MAHEFQRVRMEPQPDGSVNIGISIVALGQDGKPDPDFHASAQWATCHVSHTHGWDTCDVVALFGAREKDSKGVDIVGSSKREQLEAWLVARRAEKAANIPKEIPIPTKKDAQGKEIKDIDGKTTLDKVIALQ
jgi:hypothetical protein